LPSFVPDETRLSRLLAATANGIEHRLVGELAHLLAGFRKATKKLLSSIAVFLSSVAYTILTLHFRPLERTPLRTRP
jgi:hypothetical protein